MRLLGRRSWSALSLVVACGVGALGPRASTSSAADEGATPRLTRAQLKELVGPVALYPDLVLASLLPATTFPLDVVAAARWLDAQRGAPAAVPDDRGWDASVQALVQFPDVVTWLNENLEWMRQMGEAVATQQAEVLQAIQDFRRESVDAGNVVSGKEIVVRQEPASGAPEGVTILRIEPANPQVVYVPVYDPVMVCRPWYGPARPLLDFTLGFTFGVLGAWAWHEIGWGWWDVHVGVGWYGGIYVHHDPYYWGHPRPSGWATGPHRPSYWQSTHYGPRPASRAAPIARPSHPRSVYGVARPGGSRPVVGPPVTRTALGARSFAPSPVAPTTSTRRVPGSTFPTTRSTATSGAIVRPTTVPTPGHDLSGDRGHGSLRTLSRPSTTVPTFRPATQPTTRSLHRATAPTVRSVPAYRPPTSSSVRAPSTLTRQWSTRGHASLRTGSAPRAPSAPRRHR